MTKKLLPIDTIELCSHGCGKVAKYISRHSKKYCCESFTSKCEAIRNKSSLSLKHCYKNGSRKYTSGSENYKNLPFETKERMAWSKGKQLKSFDEVNIFTKKEILIKERGYCCESCKLSSWLDKPITIELDHIDGNNKNNSKDNLRLLCPNCHSQTPTWRRAKVTGKKIQKYSDDVIIETIKNSKNLNEVLTKLDLRYGSVSTIVKIMVKYNLFFEET